MTLESDRADLNLEQRLQETASSFQYPATPDIHRALQKKLRRDGERRPVVDSPATGPVRWRRPALAAFVLLLALAALLAVPEVRAAMARFLRVGAITIFVGETDQEVGPPSRTPGGEGTGMEARATRTPVPSALPTKTHSLASEHGPAMRHTAPALPDTVLATPLPTSTVMPTPTATRFPAQEGPLTLAEAEAAAGFSLRLPASSTGVAEPDEIYLQRLREAGHLPIVILVWLDPQGLSTARLALYQIGVADYGLKSAALESVEETTVNGRQAYWVGGEHLLQLPLGNGGVSERLAGNVLVWTEGSLTYRLEGAPSLVEAVRIAESLESAIED